MASKKIIERHFMEAAGLLEHFQAGKGFNHIFQTVKVLSLGDGKVTAEVKVEEKHLNPMGTLHGGFSTSLLDALSTTVVLNKFRMPNATININLSLISSATVGDLVLYNASVVKGGKNFAFVDVNVTNKETGTVLVKGILTHARTGAKL